VFDNPDDAGVTARRMPGATEADWWSWAVVRWDRNGRLPGIDVPVAVHRKATKSAWFWSLLLGVTFSVPALGAAMSSAGGLEAGTLTAAGIHDTFMNRLRDAVVPGRSALLVLTVFGGIPAVDALVEQRDVVIVASVLFTPHQEAALLEALS
jgi:uncharacterized membrane protein